MRSMARKMMPARDARPAAPMPDAEGGGIMIAMAIQEATGDTGGQIESEK